MIDWIKVAKIDVKIYLYIRLSKVVGQYGVMQGLIKSNFCLSISSTAGLDLSQRVLQHSALDLPYLATTYFRSKVI